MWDLPLSKLPRYDLEVYMTLSYQLRSDNSLDKSNILCYYIDVSILEL